MRRPCWFGEGKYINKKEREGRSGNESASMPRENPKTDPTTILGFDKDDI